MVEINQKMESRISDNLSTNKFLLEVMFKGSVMIGFYCILKKIMKDVEFENIVDMLVNE